MDMHKQKAETKPIQTGQSKFSELIRSGTHGSLVMKAMEQAVKDQRKVIEKARQMKADSHDS